MPVFRLLTMDLGEMWLKRVFDLNIPLAGRELSRVASSQHRPKVTALLTNLNLEAILQCPLADLNGTLTERKKQMQDGRRFQQTLAIITDAILWQTGTSYMTWSVLMWKFLSMPCQTDRFAGTRTTTWDCELI